MTGSLRALQAHPEQLESAAHPPSFLGRIFKYALVRGISLFFVVLVSVFLTLLITSKAAVVESELSARPGEIGGWFSGVGAPKIYSARRAAAGGQQSDEPLVSRSLRLMYYGLTLNLGSPEHLNTYSGGSVFSQPPSDQVRLIILDTLPRTLLLFGTANVLIFFTSTLLALYLSRRFGGWLEKALLALTPLSAVPPWIYGLVITILMVKVLHIYTGGRLDAWPDKFTWSFLPVLAKHMLPAILAIFLSKFFQSVYTWRSFFLIHAGEDFIDLAKAKGLPDRWIERRYILRPLLPNFITSFAMLMIGIWQEAIIIELFFSVAGIGHIFYNAVKLKDMPLIVGMVVVFAYLMAITVFILDILYAIIDPRVKIGADRRLGKIARLGKHKRPRFSFLRVKPPIRELPVSPAAETASAAGQPVRAEIIPSARTVPRRFLHRLSAALRELSRYPSAAVGLAIILVFVAVSIYTPLAIPYRQAVQLWNLEFNAWLENPKMAAPEWVNFFRREDLPKNIFLDSREGDAVKTRQARGMDVTEITIAFPIDYPYGGFPQNITLALDPEFEKKIPYVSLDWVTPDGRQVELGDFTVGKPLVYDFTGDSKQNRALSKADTQQISPEVSLFADASKDGRAALPGQYELRLNILVFEPNSDMEARLELHGEVFGMAGTDHRRRDLTIGLLWGIPVALALGLLGALGTALTTMVIAAVGAWFGGWIDGLIQRITEVNMILPAFPILLIVYNFYSSSFWALLGVAVLLNVFGSAIKSYRSAFLQVRESPYIEAAQSYGASPLRIIFRYLIPRIAPVLVPQLAILVPSFVFLEVTLAYLKMSDPLLPTLGKVLQEGIENGGLSGAYHWVLEPTAILLLIGFAFLMVGFALERILNPRLRST